MCVELVATPNQLTSNILLKNLHTTEEISYYSLIS